MKLFFVGDFKGNNGPANVNKMLKKNLPDTAFFATESKEVKRVLELLYKIPKSEGVVFSGLSKINIVGFVIARIFNKKSAYLMHGSEEIEGEINKNKSKRAEDLERKVLKLAPKVICVSEFFMEVLKKKYPPLASKITYVNNGVDWELLNFYSRISEVKKKNKILSIGGGIPLKNIRKVCEAIELLNTQSNYKLTLTVIGKYGKDSEYIKSFSFVKYYEKLSYRDTLKELKSTNLYVQNSLFESFGLAPVEALLGGSSILVSQNVGAKSLFKDLSEKDIIFDPNDINEISIKIKYLLKNSNHIRLISSIDRDNSDYENACQNIIKIFENGEMF
ncbi:glycosyltransferase family 4 protein [Planococcus shenhongbingii]|uniref:glycosyltransferase family 4 protein n=1 Tax=Planococcus shenhongbingii TaxID=3058398 RepID=UPI00262526EF|nr:glycosyltransferase family 4 protein [Planococcus sp. N016]WKA57819.1 glycosyltransferase family 4 protein [Planococcus sp. N016]